MRTEMKEKINDCLSQVRVRDRVEVEAKSYGIVDTTAKASDTKSWKQ